jgi:sec-independent protein translocase protein TatC
MKDMTVTEHLTELRNRLLVACVVVLAGMALCYTFKEPLFNMLVSPVLTGDKAPSQLVFIGVPELFFTYLKLSFLGGFFLGFPILLWEVWKFTAPGLYQNERKLVAPFFILTPFLFYAGGIFTYFVVMPLVTEFFFQFQTETVVALPSVKNYLAFFSKMVFAFGLAFEMPLLMLLLIKAGVVSLETLRKGRRYAIVGIFVMAAVLTPPDPMSQMLLAVPMIILYELALLFAKSIKPQKQATEKSA